MINLKDLIIEYESIEDNHYGGNLHIILEDFNTCDSSIIFCYRECKLKKDYLGMLICSKLYFISEDDREQAIKTIYSKYQSGIGDLEYLIGADL